MSTRDEFSAETRRALAERAGYRCAFPGCGAVTIGPSNESELSVSKTGMACHIAAAASGTGARRYVPSMSTEVRTSIENGIWMCYTHGKLVDTDEKRFTIAMLQKWREIAEFRAQWIHDNGTDSLPIHILGGRMGFADAELKFNQLGNENELVGNAFVDCCIELVWTTEISRAARDVVIEIIRNSLTHGKAKECVVQIRKGAIYVRDDGVDFSCLDLQTHKNGRGGATAIRYLAVELGKEVIIGSKRDDGVNETILARAGGYSGILLTKPCCIQIGRQEFDDIKQKKLPARLLAEELNPCRIVYLMLPQFVAPSDAYILRETISPDAVRGKQIVFVAGGASLSVCQTLSDLFPGCRVLQI